MIPQTFIQDLLARVDIVDVVGRYVPLKKGGANFMGLCPFHSEKSPSFTVSPAKQFYHCFGCGAHGTAISFMMEYSGQGFVEAVKDLAQNVGMVVPEEDRLLPEQRVMQQAKNLALTDVMARSCEFYRHQLRGATHAIDYLKKRGLTGEIAARFGIGYAPAGWDELRAVFPDYDASVLVEAGLVIDKSDEQGAHRQRYDRFRDRIMFPIRNTKGQVIGFGGRVLDKGEPKYLNSPETPLFQKGNELYGLFEARQAIRDAGYVLVTEGYMDVVALAQLGFPQAVATLGTACTPMHVQKLLRQTDHVVFSFDGDSAGRRAARRALDACLPHASDNKTLQFLFLPPEHDPDSFVRENGASAFDQAIKDAMPLSQFLLNELKGDKDLATAEGRAHLQFDAKPLVQAMPPSGLRHQIVRSLSALTQMTPAEIESLFELVQPVARTRVAPPRTKRSAPVGLERQIMRILVAHPILVSDFVEFEAAFGSSINAQHSDELMELVSTIQQLGSEIHFAALAQHLRSVGSDFDALIAEIAADTDNELEVVRLELIGALRQAKMQVIKGELEQLAATGLGGEEARMRYREISLLQEKLRRHSEFEVMPR